MLTSSFKGEQLKRKNFPLVIEIITTMKVMQQFKEKKGIFKMQTRQCEEMISLKKVGTR